MGSSRCTCELGGHSCKIHAVLIPLVEYTDYILARVIVSTQTPDNVPLGFSHNFALTIVGASLPVAVFWIV
ncbi:hypothetical protein FRX31_030895 [Thalictrum thalictroides]|uniref:Uncharacterized protein n=1 Tax=Thalictrum thalictroides TaxID=46969 RepID=A0A7J6V404_THATH|nr:hypothetical protein FRX31_030895 [Thalictrum thalictroides]